MDLPGRLAWLVARVGRNGEPHPWNHIYVITSVQLTLDLSSHPGRLGEMSDRKLNRGGQAQDLTTIRGHVGLMLSAGGLAAAFIGGLSDDHGFAFWIAVGAFAALAGVTIWVHRPVEFAWDFNSRDLVANYVDHEPAYTDDQVMRDLAIHTRSDYELNLATLRSLWTFQSLTLVFFGVEVVALLLNLAVR